MTEVLPENRCFALKMVDVAGIEPATPLQSVSQAHYMVCDGELPSATECDRH
jgi:hypothetical protein